MNTRERFENRFSVASYEVDLTGKLSLFSLFNHFQDLAGQHAEFLNVGYDLLRQSRLAWILSRIKVELISLPNWKETVTLATWPKGVDRLFALRDFCLKNENGETLTLATSAWLLVDINKGRPKRVESLPVNLQFPGAPHAIEEVPDKLTMPEELEAMFSKQIWLSDIDTNQHVNNAQYAKWISDCFSQWEYRNRMIKSVQINFLEETLLGDTVELLKWPKEKEAAEYFIAGKSLNKGSLSFNSKVTWE